jgi:hypothetical protein
LSDANKLSVIKAVIVEINIIPMRRVTKNMYNDKPIWLLKLGTKSKPFPKMILKFVKIESPKLLNIGKDAPNKILEFIENMIRIRTNAAI